MSRFLLKFFCLKLSKNAKGEPFILSPVSGIEKNWMREWGGVPRLSVKSFLSHSAEKICR